MIRRPIRASIPAAVAAAVLVLCLPASAAAAAPYVSTGTPDVTGDTTTALFGIVNPEGEATTYYLAYDLASSGWCASGGTSGSPAYTTAPVQMVNTANQYDDVNAQLTGLTLDTEYCAEFIANDADGEGDGGQVTWRQGLPRIDSTGAVATGASTATVEGEVNPGGQRISYDVQYAPAGSTWCTSAGSSGSPAGETFPNSVGFIDSSDHAVSVGLTGLTAGSSYCAKLAVLGSYETVEEQLTWTQTIVVETNEAYSAGPTTAVVRGDVNGYAESTTSGAQYALASSTWCTSGGTSGAPAGSATSAATTTGDSVVLVRLSGLVEGTRYCARLTATNSGGDAAGLLVAWTQGNATADTLGATSTSSTTATVNGEIDAAGKTTTYRLEYAVSTSTWCQTDFTDGSPQYATVLTTLPFTDGAMHDVSVDLTGLTAGGSYCSELVAGNADGSSTGPGPNGGRWWTQQTVSPASAYTLTVIAAGNGTVTSNPAGIDCAGTATCTHVFPVGTEITLSEAPGDGSAFYQFSSFECVGATCTFSLRRDTTVYATFNALPTQALTVSKAGNGSGTVFSSPEAINCGSKCSYAFTTGTPVTLFASASNGSRFSGWSGGACSVDGPDSCVVALNVPTNVTATFTRTTRKAQCLVPSLKGKTLGAAEKAIRKAHCRVGKIRRVKSSEKHRNRVLWQSAKPRRHLANGAKVSLKIGR